MMCAGITAAPCGGTAGTLRCLQRLPPLRAAVVACGRSRLGVASLRSCSSSGSGARRAVVAASSSSADGGSSAHTSSSTQPASQPARQAGPPPGEQAALGAGLRSCLAGAVKWLPAVFFCQLLVGQSAANAAAMCALLLASVLTWRLFAALFSQLEEEAARLECRRKPPEAVVAAQYSEMYRRLAACAALGLGLFLVALGWATSAVVCAQLGVPEPMRESLTLATACTLLGVPEAAEGPIGEVAAVPAALLLVLFCALLQNMREACRARGIAKAAERIAAASSPA